MLEEQLTDLEKLADIHELKNKDLEVRLFARCFKSFIVKILLKRDIIFQPYEVSYMYRPL